MIDNVHDFPILETDRLILRNITTEDANCILKYLSDEEVMTYYGMTPFKSITDALDEISWYDSILTNKSGIRWGITLKHQDRVIGSCGFLNAVPQHFRIEIGYELSKDLWGRGLASEAVEAIIHYGFKELGLQRIEALIEPPNRSSRRLVEKLGFVREGLLRNYEFTNKGFDDLYMYALLKTDIRNH